MAQEAERHRQWTMKLSVEQEATCQLILLKENVKKAMAKCSGVDIRRWLCAGSDGSWRDLGQRRTGHHFPLKMEMWD